MNWIWLFAFTVFTVVLALLMKFATGFVSFQMVVFVALAAIFVVAVDTRR